LRLQSQLKTHGSETYKKADVFIRDLLQMINKFAALLLIGMASPYQTLDWYGGRHTCHTASGALVQGRSRSLMLVPAESSSAVLVIISSKYVSICNRFHARRANSGKITIS